MGILPAMSLSPAARLTAHHRVSTDGQGRSSLGLDARREAVARHVSDSVVAAFEEVESRRRRDRPQLALALGECRLRRAVHLIAKLGRFARDAHFLLGLEKAGVEVLATDKPYANRLTIAVMVLIAEEARAISTRTKAALLVAKARGIKLGNPKLKLGDGATAAKARTAWSAAAGRHAAETSRRGEEDRAHDDAATC